MDGEGGKGEGKGESPKELGWDVLVPLTILNHPVYSPLVFPFFERPFRTVAVCALPTLPHALFLFLPLSLSLTLSCIPFLLSCQPLLFVAYAPMRNNHCSKMVSPDRASPPARYSVARHPRWPKHEECSRVFNVEIVRAIVNRSAALKTAL